MKKHLLNEEYYHPVPHDYKTYTLRANALGCGSMSYEVALDKLRTKDDQSTSVTIGNVVNKKHYK